MKEQIIFCVLVLALCSLPLSNIGLIYGFENKNKIICEKNNINYLPIIDLFFWIVMNSSIIMIQLFFDIILFFSLFCINMYPILLILCFCLSLSHIIWMIFGFIVYFFDCDTVFPSDFSLVFKIIIIVSFIYFFFRNLIIGYILTIIDYDKIYNDKNKNYSEYTEYYESIDDNDHIRV